MGVLKIYSHCTFTKYWSLYNKWVWLTILFYSPELADLVDKIIFYRVLEFDSRYVVYSKEKWLLHWPKLFCFLWCLSTWATLYLHVT